MKEDILQCQQLTAFIFLIQWERAIQLCSVYISSALIIVEKQELYSWYMWKYMS